MSLRPHTRVPPKRKFSMPARSWGASLLGDVEAEPEAAEATAVRTFNPSRAAYSRACGAEVGLAAACRAYAE
jgi:hypothetical protein